MSAVYAGIELCQTTPEVRDWIERHIPTHEYREFNWHQSPSTVFHGLTYFQHTEANVPIRLNVLRWPAGAARWGTYHFVSTDEQLREIRKLTYGDAEVDPPEDIKTTHQKLVLHGAGDTVTADEMWMLAPRPLSASPVWARANKLWLCTLVDRRYWWNQDHCGNLGEEDASSWDSLLTLMRDRTGIHVDSWDCPAVHADWLQPHLDLQKINSLPLGIMIDAIAWNVGRRVSMDMEKPSLARPPIVRIKEASWHNSRLEENLGNPAWYRMAGGMFQLDQRDLSSILPETIRMTFADGDDARVHDDITVNTLDGYTDQNGVGTVVFHDRMDIADASEDARLLLLDRVARAWLDFQKYSTHDVSYTGHVKWKPEAMSDFIEWHELHDEDASLVPDPEDGKLRKRKLLLNIARTRVARYPVNFVVEDLWHGGTGSGSGSGKAKGQTYTITCADGSQQTVTVRRT